ncbi:MAG: hypothetical protein JWL73_2156 [Actinomycetia bacterium]|nr:hypothetical protein [Actinomycetes bacterium]
MDGPAKYAAVALGIAAIAAVALGFTLTSGSRHRAAELVPLSDAAAATPTPSTILPPAPTSSTAPAPPGTTDNAIMVQGFTATMRNYVNHDPDPGELADFVTDFHNQELAYMAAKAAGKAASQPRLSAAADAWVRKSHASEILALQSAQAAQRSIAAGSTSPGGEIAGQARR